MLVAACTGAPANRHEFQHPAMGTTFRVVLWGPSRTEAAAAAAAAFARVDELEARMSDYRPDSEIARLARRSDRGAPTPPLPVSADLGRVLSLAQEVAARSDGAFDVTVGPLVRLWRRAFRQRRLPDPDRLAAARERCGWRRLDLDPDAGTVRLLAPGMRLDLGGIAKGYALDAALAVLRERGFPRALVDGGGDVAVAEPPPGRRAWQVAVAPRGTEVRARLLLARAAVATSGDAARFLELDGVRYSHLVDPRTGQALRDGAAAVVVAPAGILADALASALCVLAPEEGLALAASWPGVEAWILRADGGSWQTPGFAAMMGPP